MLSMLNCLFSRSMARAGTGRPGARRGRGRADHKVRLSLESLESRVVPTILFTPHYGPESVFGHPNGMQHPAANLVFSGSYWTSTQGAKDVSALVSATKTLLSGPYLSGLTQYGSDGTASFGTFWTDSAKVQVSTYGGFYVPPSTATVQDFLQKSITAPPGSHDWQHAPIYVVVSDPDSSLQDYEGWNAAGTYTDTLPPLRPGCPAIPLDENIHMLWIGTRTNRDAGIGSDTSIWKDAFTETLSQHLANTISDPAGRGVWVNPPRALSGRTVGYQIADNEPAQPGFLYAYRLAGNLVQPYWSACDNAFIVPDGNTQAFNLNPWWCDSTVEGLIDPGPSSACTPGFHHAPDGRGPQYLLSVVGDQYGTGYNDRINIAQTSSGGVQATLNWETASFDNGTIGAIHVDTQGGKNWVNVASVPWGVALHISGGLGSNDAVTIGSKGSLAGLGGFVDVRNDSGTTALFIDASNDPYTASLHITDNGVSFGTRGPGVAYQGASYKGGILHGVRSLTIRGSHAGSAVLVDSVPLWTTITVYGTPWDIVDGPAAAGVHFYLDWYFYYVPPHRAGMI